MQSRALNFGLVSTSLDTFGRPQRLLLQDYGWDEVICHEARDATGN
jgi:hypothetical protein